MEWGGLCSLAMVQNQNGCFFHNLVDVVAGIKIVSFMFNDGFLLHLFAFKWYEEIRSDLRLVKNLSAWEMHRFWTPCVRPTQYQVVIPWIRFTLSQYLITRGNLLRWIRYPFVLDIFASIEEVFYNVDIANWPSFATGRGTLNHCDCEPQQFVKAVNTNIASSSK